MTGTRDRPVLGAWRTLAETDILYKLIAFAVLTPLVSALLRLLIRRTGSTVLADVDIALFFFTTRTGVLALVLVAALIIGLAAIEQACLMTVLLAALAGSRPRVRDAFTRAAAHAWPILRLTALITVRVLAIVAPFVLALGVTYAVLLTGHDINFYLSAHPPAFWAAAAIATAVAVGLTIVLVRKAVSWLLALPLVVFEGVPPRRALAESTRRMEGHRRAAAGALLAWAVLAVALPIVTTWGAHLGGRAVAPAFAGSVAQLVVFVGGLALVWGTASLIVGVVTAVLFAHIVTRHYIAGAVAAAPRPEPAPDGRSSDRRGRRLSWGAIAGVLAVAVILAIGAAYVLMRSAWTDRSVLIFAHRGASTAAPENSLAAFRLAGEQHTDYVELDVQESLDGVVVVVHDSDLMKAAGSPLKIWETTGEQLRGVDIGSRAGARFSAERVPTLAEALAVCKGTSKVNIELKYYGHNQRLPERVVEVVEAAGMEHDIVTMSLNHDMVAEMERLRPEWTSGLLAAKSIGDLSRVPADFLAVEKAMATRRFIRAAHRAGKPVYVWTVDDAARMIRLIGLGVDGLITNHPDVAHGVVTGYAGMTQAERLLLFAMTTLGAEPDTSPPDSELRP